MTKTEIQSEALNRAKTGQATSNYLSILAGFEAKGIPVDTVIPRENVFTFAAWKALGRSVKKGEHGVKVCTWIPIKGKSAKPPTDGEKPKVHCRPRTATVFHVSQTQPIA